MLDKDLKVESGVGGGKYLSLGMSKISYHITVSYQKNLKLEISFHIISQEFFLTLSL